MLYAILEYRTDNHGAGAWFLADLSADGCATLHVSRDSAKQRAHVLGYRRYFLASGEQAPRLRVVATNTTQYGVARRRTVAWLNETERCRAHA